MEFLLSVTVFLLFWCNFICALASDLSFLTYSQAQFCYQVTQCSGTYEITTPIPDNSPNSSAKEHTLPVQPPPFPPDCCSKCSCEANCMKKGTCCIDALPQLPTLEEARKRLLTTATCELPQLRLNVGSDVYSLTEGVLMIRHCDPSHLNLSSYSDIEDKCQSPDKYTDINTKVPVFDPSTNISYQNIFCAQCNDVDEKTIAFWGVSVKCRFDAYTGLDLNSIVEDIRNSAGCNLIYESPNPQARTVCDRNIINRCNQTGLWRFYDPFIERACLSYTTIFDYEYKNVFCYMCNVDVDTEAPVHCQQVPAPHVFSTFSLLLNLPEPSTPVDYKDETLGCHDNEILDPVTVGCSLKLICIQII